MDYHSFFFHLLFQGRSEKNIYCLSRGGGCLRPVHLQSGTCVCVALFLCLYVFIFDKLHLVGCSRRAHLQSGICVCVCLFVIVCLLLSLVTWLVAQDEHTSSQVLVHQSCLGSGVALSSHPCHSGSLQSASATL